jgi:signal transduction histidine kinase
MEVGDTKGSVSHLQDLLDQAIGASRSLAYELSPPALYRFNLPEALQWLARWFQSNHHFNVTAEFSKDLPFVAEPIKTFLFNAVRELMLNSVKHSKGTSATIAMRMDRCQRLHIEVSDQGQGFDPARLSGASEELFGLGLFSIRERLIALGGILEIDSKPGEGARFDLSVPLRELERHHASTPFDAQNSESTTIPN